MVRLTSHSSDDDQRRYRDPAEVEELKEQDPIALLRQPAARLGAAQRPSAKRSCGRRRRRRSTRPAARAEARPEPDVATAELHVYGDADGGRLTMAELNILEAIRTGMDEELERDERT